MFLIAGLVQPCSGVLLEFSHLTVDDLRQTVDLLLIEADHWRVFLPVSFIICVTSSWCGTSASWTLVWLLWLQPLPFVAIYVFVRRDVSRRKIYYPRHGIQAPAWTIGVRFFLNKGGWRYRYIVVFLTSFLEYRRTSFKKSLRHDVACTYSRCPEMAGVTAILKLPAAITSHDK